MLKTLLHFGQCYQLKLREFRIAILKFHGNSRDLRNRQKVRGSTKNGEIFSRSTTSLRKFNNVGTIQERRPLVVNTPKIREIKQNFRTGVHHRKKYWKSERRQQSQQDFSPNSKMLREFWEDSWAKHGYVGPNRVEGRARSKAWGVWGDGYFHSSTAKRSTLLYFCFVFFCCFFLLLFFSILNMQFAILLTAKVAPLSRKRSRDRQCYQI